MSLFDDDAPFFERVTTEPGRVATIAARLEVVAPPRNEDSTIHFSDLKRLSKSALDYLDGYANPWEASRAARIGTATHRIVLGGPPVKVFSGTRRGAAWDAFVASSGVRSCEILNDSEAAQAEEIATALLCHPTAIRYLKDARYEAPLRWDLGGIPCSTRGIDILGLSRFGDLKTTATCQPDKLMRHAEKMLWHAQIGWYDMALDALGYPPRTEPPFLLCVESVRPFDVVVLELTPKRLEAGRQCCHAWLSQLRVCEETGVWPGYSTAPIEWGTADSIELFEDGDDEEEAAGELP